MKKEKIKVFLKKIFYILLVWGRPLIRERIKMVLIPALKSSLEKKKVSKKIIETIESIIEEFCNKYI